jgi:hypothetical protein
MRAAVLGYGPAGLIAAKTLVDQGIDVDVIGAGGKSVIGGAQYLHEPILNAEHVTDPEGYIEFLKVGERDGYAKKIYPQAEFTVSWDNYEGRQPAWALGPVYDILWKHFEDKLLHDTFNGMSLTMLLETDKYDVVFSSIPAHALCMHSHDFPRVNIALVPFSPINGINNVVLYSGRPQDVWYRTSVIFGEAWSEFGQSEIETVHYTSMAADAIGAEELPVHHGFKPLGTNCNCHPEVVRIGRFGRWDRKILLHHVPHQVLGALEDKGFTP